jgi:hypothetical protein
MSTFELEQEALRIEHETALKVVVEMIRANPDVAHRIARLVGYEKFVEPLDVCQPMPLTFHYSECSISDRGPPKRGTKPCREPVRYKAVINLKLQAKTVKSIWQVTADLRTPDKAAAKLNDLCNPAKCKTPFSPAERQFVEQAIGAAEAAGFLIGLPYTKPRAHGGTHFVKEHAVLVSPDFREAMLISSVNDARYKLTFAPFATSYANGQPLASNFVFQSRGIARTRELNEFATGHHELTK